MSDPGQNDPAQQAPNSSQTHDQWIRKVGLIVASASGAGLDLSALRVQFKVQQSDYETPNNAVIRVFNLAAATAQQIRKEYTQVTLQAGYQNGAYGIIFQGTIKQVRIGRNSQTETYIDIYGANSDEVYNFGMVNKSIAAGTSPKDQVSIAAQQMGATPGTLMFNTGLQSNIRGKVQYGMGRTTLRNLAKTGGCTWSIQDGKIVITPLEGYAAGTVVQINSKSGMVNLPEQTEDGIEVTCLLNPKIVIGTQVQINEGDVQRAAISFGLGDVNNQTNAQGDAVAIPPVTSDGYYYVLVAEHEGDTRDNEYYTTLTCLSINKTVPAGQSVLPAG